MESSINNDYYLTDGTIIVTPDMLEDFQRDGYIVVRKLLDDEEVGKVMKVLEESDIRTHEYGRPDRDGKEPKLILWQHPGNDVTGMVARCEKVVNTCEKLLGGEVYHYHTKLNSKEPKIGGKFEWHQDYGQNYHTLGAVDDPMHCCPRPSASCNNAIGSSTSPRGDSFYCCTERYWYKYGCLFPDMMTVFIALDDCNKDNGCLQVLRGSHLYGRINHTIVGDQTGADTERVERIKEKCESVYAELEKGDALLFHCNLLHTSSANTSDTWRRALLVAYNRASNNPAEAIKHPGYTPLRKILIKKVNMVKKYPQSLTADQITAP